MRKKPYLSVIIPCYNEMANLQRGVLDEVENYLKKQSYASEVIVSDDGSTDGSLAWLEKYVQKHPHFQLLKNPHAGKAFAVHSGIKKAKGEIVLFTDMDQSTPLNQIEKLLPYFERGFEVVIGSRGKKRKDAPWYRQIIAWGFRWVRQMILLPEIVDTQCGFKAFKNKVAQDLFSRLLLFQEAQKVKGWRVSAFDVELLFVAQKRGYRVAEVEVEWQDRDIAQGKQKKFFKESKEMLKEILRVKWNDLKKKYG